MRINWKFILANFFIFLLLLTMSPGRAFGQLQEPPKSGNPTPPQSSPQGGTPAQTPALDTDNMDVVTAVPNRPTLASTAETVQRGVLEVEFGFEGAHEHQDINGLVKFGLVKSLEIRFFNNPLERDRGTTATGDSGVGFKWKVFPQKKVWPTFSVMYSVLFPTAGHDLGIGATGHQLFFLASKDFGRQHFDANFGINYFGRTGTDGYDHEYFYGLDWTTPLTKKWGLTSEIASFSKANLDSPATLTLLVSPNYTLKSWLVLDFGANYAVYGNYPRWTFLGGVTYSIADLYHKRLSNHPPRQRI
jgi:hypothetical protein